jgi:O-antigen ligase
LGLRILEEIGYDWRAAGTFEHPGVFADFLILILPIVVRLLVFQRHDDKKKAWLYFALLAFGAGGLLGSYGRGPWVSFAGAMIVMFVYSLFQRRLRPRAMAPMLLLAVAGVAFAVQYADTILVQFTGEDRKSSSEVRRPLNNVAMRMAKDHAITGVGLGGYRLVSLPYARLEYDPNKNIPLYQLAQIAHNSYLLITCETGVAGALAWLFFIFSAFRMGRRVLKLNNTLFSNLTLGMLTGMLGFIVSINSGPNIMNHQLIMFTWLFAGWITGMSRHKPAPARRPSVAAPMNGNGISLPANQDLTNLRQMP